MNKGLPRVYILLGLLIVFYLINGVCYLQSQSITSDEGSFVHYAIRYLKGDPGRSYPRTDNSKMPVSVLNLVPRIAEKVFFGKEKKEDGGVSDIMNGRYVTLFFSVFTILLVFYWSSQIYGNGAGLFSAMLLVFCPNSLANAGLVTTDSYSSLFLLLTIYLLWKFCRTGENRFFLLFSISIALSQVVKQSLFHLYVLAPVILLVDHFINRKKLNWQRFTGLLALFILANFLIINLGYYFDGSFTKLGDFHFMSDLFKGLQDIFPENFPLPLPEPFVTGLDQAKYYDQLGGGYEGVSSFGKVTILGLEKTGGGFWFYYFMSLFYKMPITFIALAIWAIILLIKHRSRKKFFQDEFFLMAPVVYYLIVMSFFYQTQCGIRHIIFIFPLIYILSGIVIRFAKSRLSRGVIILLSLFLVFSVLRYWKNYYPYTNEFIPDKKMAFMKVGAGNLEFLQGNRRAMEYFKTHPGVRWAPEQPSNGRFLINTEDYLDVWNRDRFDWIRQYAPVDHVAYNFLLIDVNYPGAK